MDRLVQAVDAVRGPARADRRRGEHTERAGQDRRLVRQDVAEEILRHEHVERGRRAHDLHGARIDEPIVERHVRVLGGDLVDHGPPQARGGQDVRLVHAGEPLPAPPRELEGEVDDPGNLGLRVREQVVRGARADRPRRLAPLSEIEAAGQLAHDQHVDAVEQLRPKGRGRHQRRVDAHRAEVREQAQPAAHGEQRLLGPDRRGRVVPSRAADGTEEDRVARRAGGQVLGADRDAVRVDPGPADHDVLPGDAEPEARANRGQGALRGGDDVRPDAVTRDGDQPVAGKAGLRGHGRRSDGRSTGSVASSRSTAQSLLAATTYASRDASMMFVERPWPVTTIASSPASVERRQRRKTRPWASSPSVTALISYSTSVGSQPTTGRIASSTAR